VISDASLASKSAGLRSQVSMAHVVRTHTTTTKQWKRRLTNGFSMILVFDLFLMFSRFEQFPIFFDSCSFLSNICTYIKFKNVLPKERFDDFRQEDYLLVHCVILYNFCF